MQFIRTHWLAGLVLVAPTAQGAPLDEDFLAAREAYQTNDAARLDVLAPVSYTHLTLPTTPYV